MKPVTLFTILLFTFISYGQSVYDLDISKLQSSRAKFIGGNENLQQFFAANLRYPMDLNYGTLIGIIVIDQKTNSIKTLTINSPGKSYQEEFERVAQLTHNKWEKEDSVNTLYCTITIDFSFATNEYFIDYQSQPSFIDGNLGAKSFSSKKLKSDEVLIESLNESYSQKDYKKVETITKELIRRNPFTESVYVMRIKALKELGLDATEELWFLTEFMGIKKYSNNAN